MTSGDFFSHFSYFKAAVLTVAQWCNLMRPHVAVVCNVKYCG